MLGSVRPGRRPGCEETSMACGRRWKTPCCNATVSAARVSSGLLPPPGWRQKSRGGTRTPGRPSAVPTRWPPSGREGCSSGLALLAGQSVQRSSGSLSRPWLPTRSLSGRRWLPQSRRRPSWSCSCRSAGPKKTSSELKGRRPAEPAGGSGALPSRKAACEPCSGGSGTGQAACSPPASLSVPTAFLPGRRPCSQPAKRPGGRCGRTLLRPSGRGSTRRGPRQAGSRRPSTARSCGA